MTHRSTHNAAIGSLPLLALAALIGLGAKGCDKEFQKAKKIALTSQSVYDAVSDPAVAKLKELAAKFEAGGEGALTDAEWNVYKAIRKFQPALDGYAELHNSYVAALKVWETARVVDASAPAPEGLPDLMAALAEFVTRANAVRLMLK